MSDLNMSFDLDNTEQYVGDFFQLFTNEYRREIVRLLMGQNEGPHQGELGVDEIAEYLENRVDNHSDIFGLKIDLEHSHLPKIDDSIENVHYNREGGSKITYDLSEHEYENLSKALHLADQVELYQRI